MIRSASGPVKPIERAPDLRRQVYERLRESLRSGQLPPDARLVENGVAREYGVSRTPAREALAMLAQEGLLVQEGRGFRPPRYTRREVCEVYDVRQALEPLAVRQAIEAATPGQSAQLSALIGRELDEHGAHDSYAGASARIRAALFGLCPNEKLKQVVRLYDEMTQYIRSRTLVVPENRALSVSLMHRLALEVGRREAARASATIEELLIATRRQMLAIMAEGSDQAGLIG